MSSAPPRKVVVAGGAIGNFRRCPDLSLAEIATPVVHEALAATGLEPRDIQAAFVGNAFAGTLCGQESILAQVLLAAAGLVTLPVRTIKNACSSGSDAVHLAWSAIAFGQYECTLVLVKNLSSELAAAGRAAVDHARHVVERGIALTWARRWSWRVHLAGVRGAVHAIHDVRVMITTK